MKIFCSEIHDVTKYAFQFLNPKELSIAAKVCKSWNIMANDEIIWKALLAKITDYRKDNESAKITYKKIQETLRGVHLNLKRAQEEIEYAKILLQTPQLAIRIQNNFIRFIVEKHPQLISIISKDKQLKEKLKQALKEFLNSTQKAWYTNLLVLIHDKNPELLSFINQDDELVDLYQETAIPDPTTAAKTVFVF